MDASEAVATANQTGRQTVDDWSFAEGALLAVVGVVGFLVNLFIVAAILSSRQLRRRVTDVLCCHLALVGIVWCVLLLPVNVVAAFTGGWPLRDVGGSDLGGGGGLLCHAHGYAQATLVHVMVWTIAAVGWNKYRTITTPLRYASAVNWQRIAAVLFPTWATALMLACVPLISGSGVGSYGYGRAVASCVYESSLATDDGSPIVASIVYLAATTFFGFLLPIGVTTHAYFRIYHIARWHRKRIAVMSAVVHVITISVGVPMSGQGLPEVSRQAVNASRSDSADVRCRERKTSRNVLAFVVALVLCYAPHYALIAVTPVLRRSAYSSASASLQFPVPVEALSEIAVLASPVVNGFIYGVRNRAMIRSFRSFIRPPTQQRHMMSNV